MNRQNLILGCVVWTVLTCSSQGAEVYPLAILPFEERGKGMEGEGAKASDVLFAQLVTNPQIYLVDRADMTKLLQEQELNLTGMVSGDQAVQLGRLTGAKILLSGSVIDAGSSTYLVAKLIGTETSRVIGEKVKGNAGAEIAELAEQLAGKLVALLENRGGELVAKPVSEEDAIAALKAKLGEANRPVVKVTIEERHVGQATIDPAAETEMAKYCRETGFTVIDADSKRNNVDVLIKGEGFSEFASRRGDLISVKARVEIKAIDASSQEVIAIDREVAVAVDLTEQLAGKTALQAAAAQIAQRMLPDLVDP